MALWSQESLDERKANKSLRDRQRIEELAKKDAVVVLMGSRAGRDYLRWILFELCGVLTDPYSDDPIRTAYACGIQATGRQLLGHLLEIDPNALSTLTKEQDNEQHGHDTDGPANTDPGDGGAEAERGGNPVQPEPTRYD